MQTQDRTGARDHDSDPARTPGHGWVDEGGASHLGPATHIEAGRERTDDEGDAEEDGEQGEPGAADESA